MKEHKDIIKLLLIIDRSQSTRYLLRLLTIDSIAQLITHNQR